MRLEKVEIAGFKSFCDRQELDFRAGVTGIVGPNGCGKSNISDAISWVLGEQSVKSLRGAAMGDVIFAGSQSRQPLAMAEVSLRVSGLNGNSPDGSPECVVGRRLYRSGESEYLMNGQVCRLRDIHELFMDTGLGSKAYSIIEQGKIGQILSSKPADRRALIEEAAGITKYRARRRQTSLKLEAAQQNLLRVNDIVNEVDKQLQSLKRQASKARRYHALREQQQGVERIVFGRRFLDLEARAQVLEERRKAEAQREQAASIALDAEEAQLSARRTALYDEENRLEAARGRQNELTLAVDRHQGRSGYCKEQIAEAQARTEQARLDAERLKGRVGPLSEELLRRQREQQELRAEHEALCQAAAAAEQAMRDVSALQASREAELDAARDQQIALISRIATLQNSRESVSGNAERAGAELLKLAAERAELEKERTAARAAHEAAQRREREAESLLGSLRRDRDEAVGRAAAASQRAEAAAREAETLQSERDGLAGRLLSLQEVVASHSSFDAGVRVLLERPEGLDVRGVVADSLESSSTYEPAVEAFLGEQLQAVLVPDATEALKGIRYLEDAGAGRGVFLPIAERPAARDEGLEAVARKEPRVIGLLSDHYRVVGPHAELIRGALEDALLLASLEEALDVRAKHGPLPCVTLTGETLRGTLVEGGHGATGLLAPRRQIRELLERQELLLVELGEARQRVGDETRVVSEAGAEAKALEERIHTAEKEMVAIRAALSAAEDESGRIHRKASVLDAERAQAEEEQGAAAVRLAEIEHQLGTAEAERQAGSERLDRLAQEVSEARAATEAAQARSAEERSQLAALRERVAAAEADCQRLTRDHQELEERIRAAEQSQVEMEERREALRAELAGAESKLAEALIQRDRTSGEVTLVEDRVRDLRNELEGREHALKERRAERETLHDALSELEVGQARFASDLDHLARESHQAIGRTAAEAAALLTEEELGRDLEALTTEIEDLRRRLDNLGPVNVLAVEQTQELSERLEFLTAQRQDLLDSIAELDQAIKKIDRTSKERFREAFQVINQHFGEVFQRLFGGGTAGLSLIDESDILESGIDVMAQPPGKRLQSVMLLSGGEKALTAIALLFAIFQYKPSPFCILDEVDAPLDDANIGRFVRMLEGLKDQTQFVLITHSRKTMEIADQLYGVTMEEPGVSKLVSVRLS